MAAFGDDRLRTALVIALVVDFLQIIFLPLFAAGAVSPVDEVIDVVVAFALIRLLGWHWAFLPTFVVELFPVVDLVPSWTLAVLIVARRMPARKEPA
jgi:hypothetical protein